ncbi:MAG: cbb3-type cytochrome c oxidase N-terminal domain-containing protein [Planctomycetota bacterium]
MADKTEKLTDHAYDGIQEFDNPAPGWWSLLLFGSIVFSVFYVLVMHFSLLRTNPEMQWDNAQSSYYQELFGEIGTLEPDAPTIVQMANDEKWTALGSSIYAANCAQCHAGDGSGGTGPNLTDNAWIHAKKIEDIYTIIDEGVTTKGMPAWGIRLNQNEMVLVSAFVANMNRNSIAGGKQAEGEILAPWDLKPSE